MILQKKQKCLIDSGTSINVIIEHSIPKTYHIEKCNESIKDLSGQLSILGPIFTEIGGVKTMERFVVILKEHKMPGDVILGSDLLSKWECTY